MVDQAQDQFGVEWDEDLVRLFARESAETYRILAARGVRFSRFIPRPRQHTVDRMAAVEDSWMLGRAFEPDFAAPNVTTLYGTLADRLVIEQGRVTGVRAHRVDDGAEIVIAARRGVILATGGYQSNPELRGRYQPGFVARAPYLGIDTCRGDGHLMGQAAGGDLINMTFVPPLVVVSSSVVEDAIAVNQAGERFHDEAGPYEERVDRLRTQPGRRAWYIVDDVVAREKAGLIGQMPEPPVIAPSMAALAAAIGVPAAALEQTVAQGLVTGDPHAVLGEILEQAEAADRLGFSAALTTEHKYSDEYFGSPLHLAYAIAARTRRVRVGTAIAIAPLYNPVELAQDAAMLDQLSGGRAWLGLGVGYMPVDYSTVGVSWQDRAQRFDETVRIVRAAHTSERFSFADTIYSFDDVSVIPRPVQRDGVPLHLAAWTPGGLRRAARLGDGWITNALMSLPTMSAMTAAYRAEAQALGRPTHVTSIRFCWPYRSREQALRDFGDTALAMAKTLFEYGAITDLPGVSSAAEITLEEFMRDRSIFGTPDECAETIGRFRDECGADDFLMIFRYPTGPGHPAVLEAMELFAAEVMPRLDKAPVA